MNNNVKKMTQLINTLEEMDYEVDLFSDNLCSGFLVLDGKPIVAEVHSNGTYVISPRADDELFEVIGNAFKKVVDK